MRANKLSYYALLIISGCFFVAVAAANEGGIQVVGNAQISVVPDMATFSFSIEEQGMVIADLKGSIDGKSAALVSLCKRIGIAANDITASEVSIRPQYNHQSKAFIGYDISRVIKVTLKQLTQYSALVNGAIAAGITTIQSINLDTKDRDVLENKALGSAVDNARLKAEIIASRTHVQLGRVVSVKERDSHFVGRTLSASSVGAVPQGVFEPGEITVSATVDITYEIE